MSLCNKCQAFCKQNLPDDSFCIGFVDENGNGPGSEGWVDMDDINKPKTEIIKTHAEKTGVPFVDLSKGYVCEVDGIIGLAKADKEVKDYLIASVLKEFGKDILDMVWENGDLDDRYRDYGWRTPL